IKVLSSRLDLKPIIQHSARFLNVTALDMAKLAVPEYFAIPINYFSHLKRSVVDIYEKILLKEDQFAIKIEAFKEFDASIIRNFISAGATHLYVKRLDRLKFVNNVTQEIISSLGEKDLDEDDSLIQSESNHELLQGKLASIGITEETVALAQKSMKSIISTAKQYPRMGKLMQQLLNNKMSYRFKNVQIITYIGQHMMDNIDWGNQEQ